MLLQTLHVDCILITKIKKQFLVLGYISLIVIWKRLYFQIYKLMNTTWLIVSHILILLASSK